MPSGILLRGPWQLRSPAFKGSLPGACAGLSAARSTPCLGGAHAHGSWARCLAHSVEEGGAKGHAVQERSWLRACRAQLWRRSPPTCARISGTPAVRLWQQLWCDPGLASHDACVLVDSCLASDLQGAPVALCNAAGFHGPNMAMLGKQCSAVLPPRRSLLTCRRGGLAAMWGPPLAAHGASFMAVSTACGSASARCAHASPHCMLQQGHASG